MGRGNGERIAANVISSRHTNATVTNHRPAFAVYHTVEVRMYPHVKSRWCTPTKQTVLKNPTPQIYINKGSMAIARKQNLRAGMASTLFLFLVWFGIHRTSVLGTAETHTGGGAYWGNPKVARLQGTTAILF